MLNRSLDFDARILHQAAIGQPAIELDQRVEAIAAKIMGEINASSCRERLRISTDQGGGGLVPFADKTACGYLVAVRQVAAGFDSDTVAGALAQRVLSGCRACQVSLAANGIHLRPGGALGREAEGSIGVSTWLRAGPAAKQSDAIRLISETRTVLLAAGRWTL